MSMHCLCTKTKENSVCSDKFWLKFAKYLKIDNKFEEDDKKINNIAQLYKKKTNATHNHCEISKLIIGKDVNAIKYNCEQVQVYINELILLHKNRNDNKTI